MVDDEYAGGRNTIMGDDELDTMVRLYDVELHKLFNACPTLIGLSITFVITASHSRPVLS